MSSEQFKNILDDLCLILLTKLDQFNKQSLSITYDEFKSQQDFSKLSLLEAGNEAHYEQWYFKNNPKSRSSKPKRVKPFDIHPNNISLQEYKDHTENNSIEKHPTLIRQTLHRLLFDKEQQLGKSFKLTSKLAQDELFTDTILEYMVSSTNSNTVNLLKRIMQNGGNEFMKVIMFNHPHIIEYYSDILTAFHEYINTVIKRLDTIPEIEQKTPAWFELRANMISASICGYIDGYVSGAGIGKEHEKIKEKSGITSKKNFSMGTGPLKHGILFEDVTGEIYDTLNGLVSKEYGILPDYRHSVIGASPDGIIVGYNNSESKARNLLQQCKFGRMREIKNPTTRSITNGKIPNYYYYQMLQQMYVCDLPYCDFIQTSVVYPETNMERDSINTREFYENTFDVNNLDMISTFQDLSKYLPSYIIKKINWWEGIQKLNKYNDVLSCNMNNIEAFIIHLLKTNWDVFCDIPLCNLTHKGKIKGIFWYYTKGEKETHEYKYCWTPVNKPINALAIGHIAETKLQQWVNEGYTLEDKYYFYIDVYDEKEIEYNQCMYVNALERLLKRWDFVMELRSIPEVSKRLEVFQEKYILSSSSNKARMISTMRKDEKQQYINTIEHNTKLSQISEKQIPETQKQTQILTLEELMKQKGITTTKSNITKKRKKKPTTSSKDNLINQSISDDELTKAKKTLLETINPSSNLDLVNGDPDDDYFND
jgi:hypothetical protein